MTRVRSGSRPLTVMLRLLFQRRPRLGSPAVGISRLHGAMGRPRGTHRQGQRKGRGAHARQRSGYHGQGCRAKGRTPEEIEQIRAILRGRFDDLNAEYEDAVAENHKLRLVEIGDAAGDDQADSGSKTAERDAATSLLRTLLDRRTQAEHAMQRLEDGTYGNCEGCSQPDPGGAAGGLPLGDHLRQLQAEPRAPRQLTTIDEVRRPSRAADSLVIRADADAWVRSRWARRPGPTRRCSSRGGTRRPPTHPRSAWPTTPGSSRSSRSTRPTTGRRPSRPPGCGRSARRTASPSTSRRSAC